MDAAYIRGYLDGLCDVDDLGVWYDNSLDEWVCNDNNKRISLRGDFINILVVGEDAQSYPLHDVIVISLVGQEVKFKVSMVI